MRAVESKSIRTGRAVLAGLLLSAMLGAWAWQTMPSQATPPPIRIVAIESNDDVEIEFPESRSPTWWARLERLPPAPDTRTACERAGGLWRRVGQMRQFACIVSTADAGKPCTDHAECEAFCVWLGEPPKLVREYRTVTGTCFASREPAGHCIIGVRSGRTEDPICID